MRSWPHLGRAPRSLCSGRSRVQLPTCKTTQGPVSSYDREAAASPVSTYGSEDKPHEATAESPVSHTGSENRPYEATVRRWPTAGQEGALAGTRRAGTVPHVGCAACRPRGRGCARCSRSRRRLMF